MTDFVELLDKDGVDWKRVAVELKKENNRLENSVIDSNIQFRNTVYCQSIERES